MTTDKKLRSAADLSAVWAEYRRRVWEKLPFDEQIDTINLSTKMSEAITAAVDALRDPSSEDNSDIEDEMPADFARNLEKLRIRMRKIVEHLQVSEDQGGPNLRWSGRCWQHMDCDGSVVMYKDIDGSAENILRDCVDDWPEGTSLNSRHGAWLKKARELL